MNPLVRCLYCKKELPLLKRLSGAEFCSDAHRKQYKIEFNELALNRLVEAKSTVEPQRVPTDPGALQTPVVDVLRDDPKPVAALPPQKAAPPPPPPSAAPERKPQTSASTTNRAGTPANPPKPGVTRAAPPRPLAARPPYMPGQLRPMPSSASVRKTVPAQAAAKSSEKPRNSVAAPTPAFTLAPTIADVEKNGSSEQIDTPAPHENTPVSTPVHESSPAPVESETKSGESRNPAPVGNLAPQSASVSAPVPVETDPSTLHDATPENVGPAPTAVIAGSVPIQKPNPIKRVFKAVAAASFEFRAIPTPLRLNLAGSGNAILPQGPVFPVAIEASSHEFDPREKAAWTESKEFNRVAATPITVEYERRGQILKQPTESLPAPRIAFIAPPNTKAWFAESIQFQNSLANLDAWLDAEGNLLGDSADLDGNVNPEVPPDKTNNETEPSAGTPDSPVVTPKPVTAELVAVRLAERVDTVLEMNLATALFEKPSRCEDADAAEPEIEISIAQPILESFADSVRTAPQPSTQPKPVLLAPNAPSSAALARIEPTPISELLGKVVVPESVALPIRPRIYVVPRPASAAAVDSSKRSMVSDVLVEQTTVETIPQETPAPKTATQQFHTSEEQPVASRLAFAPESSKLGIGSTRSLFSGGLDSSTPEPRLLREEASRSPETPILQPERTPSPITDPRLNEIIQAAVKSASEELVLQSPATETKPVPVSKVQVANAQISLQTRLKKDEVELPQLDLGMSAKSTGVSKIIGILGAVAAVAAVAGALLYFNHGDSKAVEAPTATTSSPGSDRDWILNFSPDPKIPRSVSLLRSSLALRDYRIEFDGAIDVGGLGWVLRAKDAKNFYVTRIEPQKPSSGASLLLSRYAVLNGVAQAPIQKPVVGVNAADGIYHVRSEAIGTHFTTWIQGSKADDWTDPRISTGGAGLYANSGEHALLHGEFKVTPVTTGK